MSRLNKNIALHVRFDTKEFCCCPNISFGDICQDMYFLLYTKEINIDIFSVNSLVKPFLFICSHVQIYSYNLTLQNVCGIFMLSGFQEPYLWAKYTRLDFQFLFYILSVAFKCKCKTFSAWILMEAASLIFIDFRK